MSIERPDSPQACSLNEHRAGVWNLVGDHGPDVAGLSRASAGLVHGFAGFSLSTDGRAGPQVRFASDETSSRIEDYQLGFDEGPCRDAAGTRQAVEAADLATEIWRRRWPRFTPAALNAGVRAVLALPLHAGGVRHDGALDLYRRSPGEWSGRERAAASDLADAGAELLTLEGLGLRLTSAFADSRADGGCEPRRARSGGDSSALVACWFDSDRWPAARSRVRKVSADEGLSGTEAYEFVLAVHEAATNVIRHGGGHGQLILWRRAGHLWCEITDHGPGIPARTLPIRKPGTEQLGNRGLWIIRRLCTSSKVTTDATGTRLLLSYRFTSAHPGKSASSPG